jgi:pyruvate dehydrogenase E1 component
MRAMLERREDVFYYVTAMNENYPQPSLPPGEEADDVAGLYRFGTREAAATGVPRRPGAQRGPARVRLLGSGAIFPEVVAAAALLADDWGVTSELWSVTSFSELARDARDAERRRRLDASADARSHVQRCLDGDAPIVAATDYVRAYPQLIAPYVRARFVALGTDGFGRSDTRAALRRFFEVDRHHVVVAALDALALDDRVAAGLAADAVVRYGLDRDAPPPWLR